MRDFDAANLEKFPGVISNSSMTKKDIWENELVQNPTNRIIDKLKSNI